MKIEEIISLIHQWAPPSLSESYDNVGLLTGDPKSDCKGILISLDTTESVVDEAIAGGFNLIISHHPIIFGGIKKLIGANYIEKTIIKAIKNDIAIFAVHTNLDNILTGVNHKISSLLQLKNTKILSPKNNQIYKLTTFVPIEATDHVLKALFNAGAGHIGNYSEASFVSSGIGSFKGNDLTNPTIGKANQLEKVEEHKIEVILPIYAKKKVLHALFNSHPYEEVAYDLILLSNENHNIGSGMIGELENPLPIDAFLALVKKTFNCGSIKYTPVSKNIKTVAVCGGSGSFLRKEAMLQQADAFLSSDFKYHEFFDAENLISFIDIGHYETEQYTKEIIFDYIKKNAVSLPTKISAVNTNPVLYF
jgi:dinuclear metal center YbgI/SA1388 family protein